VSSIVVAGAFLVVWFGCDLTSMQNSVSMSIMAMRRPSVLNSTFRAFVSWHRNARLERA
jgi:hypothetical protein